MACRQNAVHACIPHPPPPRVHQHNNYYNNNIIPTGLIPGNVQKNNKNRTECACRLYNLAKYYNAMSAASAQLKKHAKMYYRQLNGLPLSFCTASMTAINISSFSTISGVVGSTISLMQVEVATPGARSSNFTVMSLSL